jgi:ABC-type uncharacterized transport system involved in gliding motility auxiliary subunit
VSARDTRGRFGLLALAALFVAAVVLANVVLRGIRLDLTENRLYTLSAGTYAILEDIPETINLYFFFSDRATADVPQLRTYAGRVREMLEEFEENADGRLNVRVVDPLPFSEEEDRATEFGLQGVELSFGGDQVFMGIAGTNSIGDEEVIPFLDPTKEAFLEYELAKLVHTLSVTDKPVIGLLTPLQMTAGFDPATQQLSEPWVIVQQAQQLFELRTLPLATDEIDADVDVLMVVHPKDLGDATLYAIDQFIMRGGRALLFVDPYAQADSQPPPVPGMSQPSGGASDLNTLLEAWGLSIPTGQVIGDDRFALSVTGFGNRPVRYLPLLGVDTTGIDPEDVTTAGIRNLNLGFTGYIEIGADTPLEVVPLVRSSDLAGTLNTEELAFTQDPAMLRANFAPSGEPYVLAARLKGEVPSAFPDGPPPLPDAEASPAGAAHLAKSDGPINVLLVADTDLLTDRLWVQVRNLFGQQLATAFAGNGDFVTNALDNLTGSSDLISIRGRATYTRPFTRVQDLRRDAEARFRMKEQQLQEELTGLEAKLAELQSAREDSGSLLLSPEQEAEIERFTEERLVIRKELRQVQRDLDQSIEDLGMSLKVINIFLVPGLIVVAGLALLALRRRETA